MSYRVIHKSKQRGGVSYTVCNRLWADLPANEGSRDRWTYADGRNVNCEDCLKKKNGRPKMTFEEAKEIVANIRYKPGWRISFREDTFLNRTHWTLHLEQPVKSVHDGSDIMLSQNTQIHLSVMNERSLLKFIRHRIHDFECHEADEQLLYKGKRIFNPHVEISAAKEGSANKSISSDAFDIQMEDGLGGD